MNRDYTDHSIVQTGKNTQKSPENLNRLPVIQTPEKYH